jgi:hypothetical protein
VELFSGHLVLARWHQNPLRRRFGRAMYNIFYVIGVIVVILAVLSVLGIR